MDKKLVVLEGKLASLERVLRFTSCSPQLNNQQDRQTISSLGQSFRAQFPEASTDGGSVAVEAPFAGRGKCAGGSLGNHEHHPSAWATLTQVRVGARVSVLGEEGDNRPRLPKKQGRKGRRRSKRERKKCGQPGAEPWVARVSGPIRKPLAARFLSFKYPPTGPLLERSSAACADTNVNCKYEHGAFKKKSHSFPLRCFSFSVCVSRGCINFATEPQPLTRHRRSTVVSAATS